ncbi:ATP-binding protein [Ferroplasma sp.]
MGKVLDEQIRASAILNRILYHCIVVNIREDSYRLKDRNKLNNINMNEVN